MAYYAQFQIEIQFKICDLEDDKSKYSENINEQLLQRLHFAFLPRKRMQAR